MLRPSMMPVMSRTLLAILSCTLTSSSGSERERGRKRVLGRLRRSSVLSSSASCSSRVMVSRTRAASPQSPASVASKKGSSWSAHSLALTICASSGWNGERPNIAENGLGVTMGFCRLGKWRRQYRAPPRQRHEKIIRTSSQRDTIVMSHEIELKLALGPEGPDALRRHPLLATASPVRQRLGNTYFDTPDGDLEAARMALRLRRIDGRTLQTVKTRGEGGGGLSRRGEWEWEVAGPKLDLAGLAGAAAGGAGPRGALAARAALHHRLPPGDLASGARRGSHRGGPG